MRNISFDLGFTPPPNPLRTWRGGGGENNACQTEIFFVILNPLLVILKERMRLKNLKM
ncbi:hypothetical protein [Helicobacter aurati]|uniref:hypothetical protein n=1 Tax=Helicobacter aurati TaxID=137778 RepID=UPI001315ABD1|nr:hypothetical protein [Helicobacter aurati]